LRQFRDQNVKQLIVSTAQVKLLIVEIIWKRDTFSTLSIFSVEI